MQRKTFAHSLLALAATALLPDFAYLPWLTIR